METSTDHISELQRDLRALKQSVAICQQQVQELENADGEISTRQVEVNNVAATLQQDSQRLNNQLLGSNQQKADLQEHLQRLNSELEQWLQYMIDGRNKTLAQIMETSKQGIAVQNKLVNGILLKWKRRQKIGQIGANAEGLNSELDDMEPLFDSLLTELVRLKSSVDGFNRHLCRLLINNQLDPKTQQVQQIGGDINDQITSLLWDCCVVAVQPPCILMMTRTPASDHQRKGGRPPCQPVLRFLGGTRLGIRSQPIAVQCYLISEEEAPKLLQRDEAAMEEIIKTRNMKPQKKDTLHNRLMNNEATMLEQMDRFYATFLRMAETTADRVRIPKKKYYFVFVIELTGAGISKPLRIWRLSLPVGVFSHPKQVWEQGGDASLFWNLAFSHGTILGVDEHGRFTFREWFYSVMDMITSRKGLLEQWNAGLILGFVGREVVDNDLSKQKQKTLSIKFSDRKRDLIISYGQAGVNVLHVLPVPEQMPMLGALPLDQVVRTTTQLQDIRWIFGQEDENCLNPSGSSPIKPVELLWTVIEQKQNENGKQRTSQASGSSDSGKDQDPYRRLQIHLQLRPGQEGSTDAPFSPGHMVSPQAQVQEQFLIGPTPSTGQDIGLELDPQLLDFLNEGYHSPDNMALGGSPDSGFDYPLQME